MGPAGKPWWWSEAWSDDVVDVTCMTVDGRDGYLAETWRLRDRDDVQWFAGRVVSPSGEILDGSIHLATNYVIASTGATSFLMGLATGRALERPRRRRRRKTLQS